MSQSVVVLGAGYAGAGALCRLEDRLDGDADVTWIADQPYHLVLHEVHRCISDPTVREKVTVPVTAIKEPSTSFLEAEVVDVDTGARTVHLAEADPVSYDHLLVALGSRTAFFGIEGLREHAHTLKGLDDALGINEALSTAATEASPEDPARVVVGGGGLTGVQTAGEVATFRDEQDAALEVTVIEGLESVLPNEPAPLQAAVRRRLEDRGVDLISGAFVGDVDGDHVYYGNEGSIEYDVLVWTGGITGREAIRGTDLERDERSHRITADRTFATSADGVFAIGDCALIESGADGPVPPTAQAAWQAAEVAGDNLARAVRGDPLATWTYTDMGTVVSVGHDAVAHGISYAGIPFPKRTFGGLPARTLKKAIAAKWLRKVAGIRYAARAWPDM